jgi:uncharacterized NAD(P)/FAD-binding protein YdhS
VGRPGVVSRPLSLVIIGGGAAGTLAAIRFAAHPSDAPRRVTVVEPASELGIGAAYGTRSPSHLLNVRASGMSAYPEMPGHFLAWAHADGMAAAAADFLPRMHFGRYLRASLAEVGRHPVDVVHVRARAVGIDRARGARPVVLLDDGRRIGADHLALATGNALAPLPGTGDVAGVVADPWAPGAIERLRDTGEVLIVGSGLTAVDVVLSLRDVGHTAGIRMVSSHGLLPEPHADGPLPPMPSFVTAGATQARSVRAALAAARSAAAAADDWRQIIDGFRDQTVGVWRDLPDAERRRFLRHLARRWEVRRHRMAPQVAVVVAELQATGRLRVERGRVSRLTPTGEGVRATLVAAGVRRDVEAAAVVMCIGPSADPRRDPFLSSLIDAGIASRHRLGIGLSVDAAGHVVRPDGAIDPRLSTLGSLRRGAEWESTAVPELRVHARDLAEAILGAA